MEIVILWFILSCVAGIIASNKGRFGLGYFLLSIFLTPLIGLLCALAAGKNVAQIEKRQIHNAEMRRCPCCAEIVRTQAIKCRHCGSALGEPLNTNSVEVTSSAAYGWGRWLGSLFKAG